MKKLLIVVFAIVTFASLLSAEEPFYIPKYYPQSDFLAGTPGSSGNASGGFFNPAVWGILKGPEMQFFWNDLEDDSLSPKNWTFITGSPGSGFSVQHWDYGELVGTEIVRHSLYDYQIAFGGGDDATSFGLAYNWSRGTQRPGMERDDVLSFGSLNRPCRYGSIGFVSQYALNNKDLRGILDVGIRPLGTPMLTLFGDAAMTNNERFKDVKWAAGLSVEPLPGISVVGKLFQGGSYTAGLTFSVGSVAASFLPHFDKDNEQTYSTYGVRVGFPKPDMITEKVMKDKFYLNLKFDNAIKYQRYKYFDKKGHTLTELLKTLNNAKDDPRIGGLVIKITEDMYASPELIWEVREKMNELKAEGKKIVVFLERGGMMEYYLASVADNIMVDPECSVDILGFDFGKTYYRNLLDTLGIGVEEFRYFKYKSAFESISRTDMSEGDREQLKALADGFYDIYRSDICDSREISHKDFDHIVNDVSFLNADSLLKYNLVDTTGRWDEMDDWIKSINDGKGRKRIGRMAHNAMLPQFDEWGIKPRVAIIYGLGVCAMNYGLNARRLGPVIKRARENKHIKAVVFRADSPGGDILPSDIVALELKKTAEKKPVIVTQGQVAGSGGYWISMYGDKILASPWTITGSIGVIGGFLYNDGFNEKYGLSFDHVQAGKHADMGRGVRVPFVGSLPDRNLTEEELASVERVIKGYYQDFLGKVAEGRDMTKEEVHEVAQGRIWTGTDGKKEKLIDEIGGMEMAIQMARDAAGIRPDQKIDIVEMPRKGSFNPSMFQPKLLGIKLYQPEVPTGNADIDYIRMMVEMKKRPFVMMAPGVCGVGE
ncbi:MAG: signal peptide peptidase SppA [Candidatus Hatepunaea meridiana]|nr:signal peptide peptidase SppA [Candidatus Hatepunaea meridiana]